MSRLNSLNSKSEFEQVFAQGKKIVGKLFVTYILKVPTESRVGIIASKKVGNSVYRHRAKRLLRESFRLLRPSITSPIHAILIARPKILEAKCDDVCEELSRLLGFRVVS